MLGIPMVVFACGNSWVLDWLVHLFWLGCWCFGCVGRRFNAHGVGCELCTLVVAVYGSF